MLYPMRLLFLLLSHIQFYFKSIKDYCDESSGVDIAWFKAGAAKNCEMMDKSKI
ncbi:MAG: hypothetical protein CM15mP4_0280 [Candidatus Neomarinimicrobiota bacterium]|nr:MAG: hypothetical protein CM15mP4_0280 [Candidatus Neomarinimicrobiota bacterium]